MLERTQEVVPLEGMCVSELSTGCRTTTYHGRSGNSISHIENILLSFYPNEREFFTSYTLKRGKKLWLIVDNFKWIVVGVCVPKKSIKIHSYNVYLHIVYNIWLCFQVALRRQQTSQDAKSSTMDLTKAHAMETLLAQKRDYQKHLRNLQQSSVAKNILQGTCQWFSSQF